MASADCMSVSVSSRKEEERLKAPIFSFEVL